MKSFLAACVFLALLCSSAFAEPNLTRVNKTNTLRCGYVPYPPSLIKDIKTNAWSGFDYDIVKVIADRLQLNVEYAVETGWATVVPDLNAKKFDMLCSGYWVHPNVGKYALFSRPAFFQPVFVVARTNDTRFEGNKNLNDAKLTMVALDGDNPVNIAKADFPLTKVSTLPNMTDFSQVLVDVANSKADFTIVDAVTFGRYNKNNPNKLKIVSVDKPVRTYPVSYVFSAEDVVLRDAVNAALDEMILDGTVDRIFDKYDAFPNAYYRPIVSYNNPYRKN